MANQDGEASEQWANDGQTQPAIHTLGLSRPALKVAIIETLKSRSKHSSKRDDLVRHVLRHLGDNMRGRARKEFAKRLTQVAQDLKRARIVQFYKAKNKRIRLAPGYASGYERLKRRLSRQQASASGDLFGSGATEVASEPRVRIRDLPDLPDEVYDDDEGDTPVAPEYSPTEEEDVPDEDTERLVGILSSPAEEPEEILGRADTPSAGTPDTQSANALLIELAGLLEAVPGLAVRRVFQELRLSLHVGEDVVQGTVGYLPLDASLRVRIYLPFVASAAVDLLRLFGLDDFTGTVCMASGTSQESYVVRRTIRVKSHSAVEVANMIQQLFSEAIRARESLRSGQ